MIVDRIPVIDVDSHVSEPGDLWTSRLPSKWADIMPRIVFDDRKQQDYWMIGDRGVAGAWSVSVAGWKEFPPSHPRVQSEVDPAAYDPIARIERLDQYGIAAQVLYPNILGFHLQALLATGDAAFHLACVEAYNDFLADFAAAAPGRFIPIMAVPFWDIDATVGEIERCAALGHKGILFSNNPQRAGLPPVNSRHWDPLWRAASDTGLSINFHVGFAVLPPPEKAKSPIFDSITGDDLANEKDAKPVDPNRDVRAEVVRFTTLGLMSNSAAIVDIILSGILDRHPDVQFVSVESGFGYVPYLLETLDWQWLNTGAAHAHPERMMPSDYFRRQMYATFWFERESLGRLVDLYPDNVMFESDFPHPTSLSPGPASYTESPRHVIEANLASLGEDVLRKVLHDTAAKVYKLS